MPAARYWRIIGIETYGGGDLELSEVALYDGASRVDGSATLTSSHAPIAGSLANLKDADTGTTARFAAADVFLPGFTLQWDFGADQNVTSVLFGAVTRPLFPYQFVVQYSANEAVWSTLTYALGTVYQGDGVLQASISEDPLYMSVHSVYELVSPNRSSDDYFGAHTAVGSYISLGSLGLAYTGSSIPCPELSGDFCIEFSVSQGNNATMEHFFLPSGYRFQTIMTGSGYNHNTYIEDAAGTTLTSGASGAYSGFKHLAWAREGSTNRFFQNGVLISTFTDSTVHAAGNINPGANAYYRRIRITVGHARYTSAFTPIQPFQARFAGQKNTSTSTPTLISEYTPPAFSISSAEPITLDLDNYGTGTVTGTVKEYTTPANTPLKRRVRLYDEITRRMIRETWSDPVTGAFAFTNLDPVRRYTAMAYDHEGIYRALVIDRVEAV